LGRAIVEALVAHGTSVAFTYHSGKDQADELKAKTEGRALPFMLDLADRDRPAQLLEAVEATVGPLWGLVNNAGIRRDGLLALTSDEDWGATLTANLDGTFRVTRAVLKTMLPRRQGAIVNISSLTALHGVAGQTAYGATKAAILGLT
jgi:3-oxoacyl-[acyl-carrier protein] reductase